MIEIIYKDDAPKEYQIIKETDLCGGCSF